MALRIKSRWHGEGERSLAEIAGALAFIAWRLAQDKAINLHGEDFVYENDRQRMDVIIEYLVFQLQIMDRLAHQRLELTDEERQELIVAVARKMGEIVEDNSIDLFGPGEHLQAFFDRINERAAEYAEYRYTDDGPSYPFLRHLGYEIQQIMGESQENRWVIDQVMDKDGVEVDRKLSRAMMDLFE
ncbi:MAG TPA: hypothetical protein ENJ98_01965 [Thiolapillus brandeum]|uniref:Uncharacterized protein n=1 Tax=Thiolapillus brandeum TaxID=1076588 RepID=A0A7C5MUL4_9GAMM|nr:hypothetical protein [Thiolapillus brandeum]